MNSYLGSGAGFPAGTLINTDKGLIKIHEIKLGDMVLSRSEWGGKDAPTEYRRVSRTFCSGEKLIYRLVYVDNDEFEKYEYASGKKLKVNVLFASEEYLVWNETEKDWMPTFALKIGHYVELSSFDSNKAYTVLSVYPVLKVDNYHIKSNKEALIDLSHIGFCYGNKNAANDMIIFKTNNEIQAYTIPDWNSEYNFEYSYTEIPKQDIDYLDTLDVTTNGILSTNVYNLEVEDFHTYFIGEDGIWVHDCNVDSLCLIDL